MTNITSQFPTKLKFVGLSLLVPLGICFLTIRPARACSPQPGSRPAPLEERVRSTPYVFAGTVTQANGEVLTLRVDRYFKGKGPRFLRLSGFNQHSCHDLLGFHH